MISMIRMQLSLWQEIESYVRKRLPEEACGLIAGRGNLAMLIIPVENISHSPYRYRMDPQEQFSAFQQMEAQGFDLLAIYHSHPDGPDYPSDTDINEAYYPEAVYIIVSRSGANFTPYGYTIIDGKVGEIPIVMELPKQPKN